MKLAYLILVHRFPARVIKLVNTLLSDKDVTIFIHVDAKSKGVDESIRHEFKNNERVILTPFRYKVYWGSYNQIRATLLLMKTATEAGEFDYYSLISGQDMLIQPISKFRDFLKENNGKEFMIHFKLPNPGNWGGNGGLDRLQLFWVDTKIQRYSYTFGRINRFIHKIQNTLKCKRKLRYELYGGFNWFTLSHKAIQYILNFLTQNKSYLKRYRFTTCADEIFVQTILMNSDFKNSMVNSDLRYIDWASGPEHPRIMRIDDYEKLINAEHKYIARKFDPEIDKEVIDKLSNFIKSNS